MAAALRKNANRIFRQRRIRFFQNLEWRRTLASGFACPPKPQGKKELNPHLWFWRPEYYRCTIPPWSRRRRIDRCTTVIRRPLIVIARIPISSGLAMADIYFVSLCGVCLRQCRQNFLSSKRFLRVFLFLVEK